MALRSINAVSLKDEARILGLVLPVRGVANIDVSDEQLPDVQAAIDRGDVSVAGMPKTAPQKGK